MKNNCYINVNMLFENVRVHIRVRPYPPFPTTHWQCMVACGGVASIDNPDSKAATNILMHALTKIGLHLLCILIACKDGSLCFWFIHSMVAFYTVAFHYDYLLCDW